MSSPSRCRARPFALAFRLPLPAVLLALLAGCERGCLRRTIEEKLGGGGELPQGRGDLPRSAACPEDLARCSAGRVRAAGRLAPETKCSPEGCPCPWDDLGACTYGCAVDGLELDVSRERAFKQLCAPPVGARYAIEVPPGSLDDAALHAQERRTPVDRVGPPDAGSTNRPSASSVPNQERDEIVDVACEIERWRCDHGVVFACHGARVSRFRCLADCAEEGATVLSDVTPEQAAMLLCRR